MKTTSSLDPVSEMDLTGRTLDLARPELKALMNRYCLSTPSSLLGPRSALIVSKHPGNEGPVRQAFEKDGWFVKSCLGPGAGHCPLLSGERCSLRQSVGAAVVLVDPGASGGTPGALPRLRCAADSASPGVVAVEGSLEPARFVGGTACVGALRGPDAVLAAISALLADP